MKLQVIKSFKDKETKELYAVGTEIEIAEIARINDLVARGLCKIVSVEVPEKEPAVNGKFSFFEQEFEREKVNAALKLTSVKGNIAKFGNDTVIEKVAGLNEADLKIFKEALLAE